MLTNKTHNWHIDWPLLLPTLALCALSMVVLFSAAGEQTPLLVRQGIRMLVALAAMYFMAQIAPVTFYRLSPYVYGVGLVLLLLVLGIGIVGKGAQRWLNLGLFTFQPSEIMKVGVPMMVAWLFTRRSLPPNLLDLFIALVLVALPVVLVILQPDLGTAILIAFSGLLVIFLAGVSWKHMVALLLLVGAAAPMMWFYALHDYQRRRILTLLDPWADPLGAGYHTIQSIIAVGSGGLYGKGWLNGSQTQLEFIPERSTDFIYAVFAEEFGLFGGVVLIAVYLFIVGRGLMISFYAQDTYSRLLAGALAITFFFYVFVNIGMVMGVLPVVGVPLPLISYGGTSMVTLLIGFGIIMSVNTHRKRLSPNR